MPPVVWAIEAVDELEGALFWYAQKSEALSQRFANAVERTTDEVARMPMRFAELSRVSGMRVYPISLMTDLLR